MHFSTSFITFISLLPFATAAVQSLQCGGSSFKGNTTCTEGFICKFINTRFSQCIPNPAGLAVAARDAGKLYFGTAVDQPSLTDAPYQAILANNNDFHQITPANALKWENTEPLQQGVFNFSQADAIIAIANKKKAIFRGHNCVWHNQLPDWLTNGNWTKETLTQVMNHHCSTIVGHYKGRICTCLFITDIIRKLIQISLLKDGWDVTNEILAENGTLADNMFLDTIGPGYIASVFHAAHAADPNTKLYINDFNIEGTGAKSTGMFNLVKSLREQGVPVHGIGVQAHLILGEIPSTLQENLEQFTSLGVEVAITELDVRMELPATEADLQLQKENFATVVNACANVRGCVGVTVWDFTDKYSWVPGTFAGQGAATPWDENLVKKPAYQGIINGFVNATG